VERKLLRHTLRRLGFAVLFVLVVSSCAMLLAHLAPGDATTEMLGQGASPEPSRASARGWASTARSSRSTPTGSATSRASTSASRPAIAAPYRT